MTTKAIVIFSVASIILGIASIGAQIAALVISSNEIYNYIQTDYDVAAGIWGGTIYVITGTLGIAATKKRSTSLLSGTVGMSILSIAASIAATTLAYFSAASGFHYNVNGNWTDYTCSLTSCDAWLGLQWLLMGLNAIEFLTAISLLFLSSGALCCGKRTSTNTAV